MCSLVSCRFLISSGNSVPLGPVVDLKSKDRDPLQCDVFDDAITVDLECVHVTVAGVLVPEFVGHVCLVLFGNSPVWCAPFRCQDSLVLADVIVELPQFIFGGGKAAGHQYEDGNAKAVCDSLVQVKTPSRC